MNKLTKGECVMKIFIDFEMNHNSNESASEIIELGAVMMSDENVIVSEFQSYVKPTCKLNPRILEMTKITSNQIEVGESLINVLDSFSKWCCSNCTDKNIAFYSWSTSDYKQLKYETDKKNIENAFLNMAFNNWHDYQKEFGLNLNLSQAIGLKRLIPLIDGTINGHLHSALYDAKNTAIVYAFTHNSKNKKNLDRIAEILNPSKITSCIGDMFPNLNEIVTTI